MFNTSRYTKALRGVNGGLTELYESSLQLLGQFMDFLQSLKQSQEDPVEQYKLAYHTNKTIFDLKHYAILIRDIYFNCFKTNQLKKDHFITEQAAKRQLDEMLSLVSQASVAMEKRFDYIDKLDSIDNRLASRWSHHNSPLNEISKQIEELISHVGFIKKAHEDLDQVRADIGAYVSWKDKVFHDFEQSLKLVKNRLNSIGMQISEISEEKMEELKPLINTLSKYYNELDSENNKYPIEEYRFESELQCKVPVNTQEASLIFKDLPFSQQINRWEESEIYPLILSVQERLISIYDRSLSGLFNARNRIQLLAGETDEIMDFQSESLKQYIDRIKENIDEAEQTLANARKEAQSKISNELPVSNIFSLTKLYLRFQSSVSLQKYGKRRIEKLKESWLSNVWDRAVQFFTKGLHVNPVLNDQEKFNEVIRFVDQKSYTDMDRLSQSLFFGKGHMGKTFMMQRERYDQLLRESVQRWQEGYRGSMLVYGRRLSGRSSVAEFTGFSDLFKRVIHLYPNKDVHYKGRIIEGSYNLGAILQDLDYHSISDHLCVVIDDLELWRDRNFSFYHNVKALVRAINKSGRRIFFIVTCGHTAKMKLDQYFKFTDQFMISYCTDRMDRHEIREAIMIRYGASQSGENQISNSELTKRINKIIQNNHQNIGVCLMEWYRLFYQDDEHKKSEDKISDYSFNRLIEEYRYLLTHFLGVKLTSELEIKEAVGVENFREVYRRMQLLLGCKILERLPSTRQLRINEHIVDEIENVLIAS